MEYLVIQKPQRVWIAMETCQYLFLLAPSTTNSCHLKHFYIWFYQQTECVLAYPQLTCGTDYLLSYLLRKTSSVSVHSFFRYLGYKRAQ